MFDANAFCAELAASGVDLCLEESGRIKVTGSLAARERWLPEIRAHKAAVLLALAARDPTLDRHRRFTVIQADGTVLSVSRCPPCPLADVQADYPNGVCTVDRVSETAVMALTPADHALVQAVLHSWGEDDPATMTEWIDGLARDPARLQQMRAQAVALGLVCGDG